MVKKMLITLECRIIGGSGIIDGGWGLEIAPKTNNRGGWDNWGGVKNDTNFIFLVPM